MYCSFVLAGLFRGFWLTQVRDVPSYGLYFLTYQWAVDALVALRAAASTALAHAEAPVGVTAAAEGVGKMVEGPGSAAAAQGVGGRLGGPGHGESRSLANGNSSRGERVAADNTGSGTCSSCIGGGRSSNSSSMQGERGSSSSSSGEGTTGRDSSSSSSSTEEESGGSSSSREERRSSWCESSGKSSTGSISMSFEGSSSSSSDPSSSSSSRCREAPPPSSSPGAAIQLLAGGAAGMLAWASVYPVDIIKSRMQVRQEGLVRVWEHCGERYLGWKVLLGRQGVCKLLSSALCM